MNKNDSTEAFTHYVFSQIDPVVRKSLNHEQFEEIKEAISAASRFKKHRIDIRFSIPLFFLKFYFVFLVGRDRRSKTRVNEYNRRNKGDLFVNIIFIVAILVPILINIIFVIYFYKTELGIDFFINHHFKDLIQ